MMHFSSHLTFAIKACYFQHHISMSDTLTPSCFLWQQNIYKETNYRLSQVNFGYKLVLTKNYLAYSKQVYAIKMSRDELTKFVHMVRESEDLMLPWDLTGYTLNTDSLIRIVQLDKYCNIILLGMVRSMKILDYSPWSILFSHFCVRSPFVYCAFRVRSSCVRSAHTVHSFALSFFILVQNTIANHQMITRHFHIKR